ncbi:MAG: cytochrome c biogenesis CcdA family protein [Anaerolineaceae bacterium]
MEITIGLAFLAGLASFLSPCVFSLVPAYIGYLSGRSISQNTEESQTPRLSTFSHGLAFVIGFSIVFILLGVAASALGGFLYEIRTILAKVGGIVVIIFGLHISGILRIPILDYQLKPQTKVDQKRSYFSSALLGVVFSAGWSPCVGPVLGTILTLAVNGGSVSNGVILLSAYSAGLAIPFLLAALGIGWITRGLRNYRRVLHIIEIVMGIVLIIVGIMLFVGTFAQIANFGYFVDFGI